MTAKKTELDYALDANDKLYGYVEVLAAREKRTVFREKLSEILRYGRTTKNILTMYGKIKDDNSPVIIVKDGVTRRATREEAYKVVSRMEDLRKDEA